jgi:hypothetical protein
MSRISVKCMLLLYITNLSLLTFIFGDYILELGLKLCTVGILFLIESWAATATVYVDKIL